MRTLRFRIPFVLASLVGFLAIWQLLTVLFPWFRHLTRPVRHHLDTHYFWFPTANLAWVVALLLLAGALRSRKRIAWVVLLVVVLSMVLNNIGFLIEGVGAAWFGLVFQLLVLVLLIIGFPSFAAHVRKGAWLRAGVFWLLSLLASFGLGLALVHRFPGTLATVEDEVLWTLHQLLGGVGDTSGLIEGRGPFGLALLLGFLGAVVIIGTAIIAFRSARLANAMTDRDEDLLRALIARYAAADSLAYFATRRDKAVLFSADGHAAITYRVEIGVCLASADPIGDPESWDAAIDTWRAHCRRYGLAPAVMGASASGAQAYARHGLGVLRLGDEARLVPDELSLRGPARAELRQAVARARRAGLTVRIRRQRELDAEELDRLRQLVRAWRDTEHERGFSMALGRFGAPDDGDCLLVEAVRDGGPVRDDGPVRGDDPVRDDDPPGEVVALLSFVPWGSTGVSLDLMRRSPDAPNGTVELLVTELCRRADELGVSRVSLNFAVFRSVFEQGAELGAGPLVRFWRMLLVFASRWWQLESLYRSNEKFGPTWEPRYLAYQDRRWVPRIGLAAAIAEGFVRTPLEALQPIHPPAQATAPIAPSELRATRDAVEPRRPEQVRVRLAKAAALAAAGIDPWPVAERPSHTIAAAREAPHGTPVAVAGRVLALRDLGGVVFARVRDWSGEIQVLWDAARIGADGVAAVTRLVELGDLVAVAGVRGISRSGEESILGDGVRLEAKSLHPLPDKHRGLTDPEARVRRRYLDLAIGARSRELTRARSTILASVRTSLYARGYAEVETPILQPIHGGANARPFVTHINAYDLDLYLRIAPELYLKRLCVGGMDKVFELGRAFRNEGVDFSHNPEFSLLEAYAAHGDYHTMRVLAQELIQSAARAVHGECVVPTPDGGWLDISGDWPVVTVHEAVSRALIARGGQAVDVGTDVEELLAQCALVEVEVRPGWDAGEIVLELYEHLVEGQTVAPTFYCDFPVSVSPLTRSHRSVPGLTERWDLVAFGMELGTAYSELTDPVEQRRRLTAQSLKAADGDPEAMELDEDFLQALEFGMPPTGGLGVGVDRLVMLITGASIRDSLPFPLAKPRQ